MFMQQVSDWSIYWNGSAYVAILLLVGVSNIIIHAYYAVRFVHMLSEHIEIFDHISFNFISNGW